MLSFSDLAKASQILKDHLQWDNLPEKPLVGVVLGSGLGAFADSLTQKRVVPFVKIPMLPVSTVSGHAGQFVYGYTQSGVPVLVQQGRLHFYEGHDWSLVTLPIRLQQALGIKNLILTTSTGSVNPTYNPGEFMVFEDHLNFAQVSPLLGLGGDFGERFVDLSETYDLQLVDAVCDSTQNHRPDIVLHRGTFAYVVGPHYETPAEIRALRTLGADVVSMSTVPEAIVAKQCGLRVLGLANITNYGSGLRKQTLDHSHVAKAAQASSAQFVWLLENVTKIMSNGR